MSSRLFEIDPELYLIADIRADEGDDPDGGDGSGQAMAAVMVTTSFVLFNVMLVLDVAASVLGVVLFFFCLGFLTIYLWGLALLATTVVCSVGVILAAVGLASNGRMRTNWGPAITALVLNFFMVAASSGIIIAAWLRLHG